MSGKPHGAGDTSGGAATRRGRLFILSAPSGAGKSTLCKRLRARFGQLRYSISHTTRLPRRGEIDGVHYHFTTQQCFETGILAGRWAEWADVHGNYYGTSAGFIDRCLQIGHSVLLDIDVQGTRKILVRYPDSVTIFILPPSMAVLERRLTDRGTDSSETIARRMQNAVVEMSQQHTYGHVVVNDDLNTAAAELVEIIASYGV